MKNGSTHSKLSAAGLLVTLGIIYGDIGTSPLYVMRAAIGQELIDADFVLGIVSCIFWTLTLQTTFKYVILTLQADNKGEGGTFALYALVRRSGKWLIIPAIIGGSSLLADSVITPPISISAAVEGLLKINPDIPTVKITVVIITALFIVQRFGTQQVGNFFGPIMAVWFSMLAVVGGMHITDNLQILNGFNPYYAIKMLTQHPSGFWILGAIFLCTTGVEALYSDMGHCGRKNIRVSWTFVKITLLINYFGQGAWLLSHANQTLGVRNPFYELMPGGFLIVGILVATMASIIASQAMITGAYTLISEALRLNLWPKVTVRYPSDLKGQIYVPSINILLYLGCLFVVWFFRDSAKMEAAYGLAITLTMLATSVLFAAYLRLKRRPTIVIVLYLCLFLTIEIAFLIANLSKFMHGGYVSVLISGSLLLVMYSWHRARKIRNKFVDFVDLRDYVPLIDELSRDETVNKFATHLVFLTSANNPLQIEKKILYSILEQRPKRADVYWLVHIDVLNEPHTMEYTVDYIHWKNIIRVDFRLGFRVEHKVNYYMRKVVEEMVEKHEIDEARQ